MLGNEILPLQCLEKGVDTAVFSDRYTDLVLIITLCKVSTKQ